MTVSSTEVKRITCPKCKGIMLILPSGLLCDSCDGRLLPLSEAERKKLQTAFPHRVVSHDEYDDDDANAEDWEDDDDWGEDGKERVDYDYDRKWDDEY